MEKPIRVLHVLGGMNRGGAQTMVMNLYRNIDRAKIQFDFIVHTQKKNDFDDEIKQLGGRIFRVPRYRGINHFQYKKSWNQFFKKHSEYKVIHGHVRSTASIYLKIANRYGLVTIAHSHSTSSGDGFSSYVKTALQYPIRNTADFLFACSHVAGEWLFGKKACKKRNFRVLNNAIDVNKYIFNHKVREKKRREFNLNKDLLVIGHIGRFCTAKNHDFLIDVFNKVYQKNKNVVLILIGDGELKEQIEKKVNRLGLMEHVIFTGIRSDVHELLQIMDVFLFPSLYEGLPVTLVEAQAAGLPCIKSDNVTNEITVSPLIKSISLKKSVDYWSVKVLKYNNAYRRNNIYKNIKKAGYDIKETSNWYANFILSQVS